MLRFLFSFLMLISVAVAPAYADKNDITLQQFREAGGATLMLLMDTLYFTSARAASSLAVRRVKALCFSREHRLGL